MKLRIIILCFVLALCSLIVLTSCDSDDEVVFTKADKTNSVSPTPSDDGSEGSTDKPVTDPVFTDKPDDTSAAVTTGKPDESVSTAETGKPDEPDVPATPELPDVVFDDSWFTVEEHVYGNVITGLNLPESAVTLINEYSRIEYDKVKPNLSLNVPSTLNGKEIKYVSVHVGDEVSKLFPTDITLSDGVEFVNPESEFDFMIKDDYAILKQYIGKSTTVYVPPALGGFPVKIIGDQAFYVSRGASFEEVFLPEGVESIGRMAFLSPVTGKSTLVHVPSTITEVDNDAFSPYMTYSGTSATVVCPRNMKYQWEGRESSWRVHSDEIDGVYYLVRNNEAIVTGVKDRNNLKKMNVPAEVGGYPVTRILWISSCNKLEELTLPEGLKIIDDRVFTGNYNITELILPSTLEVIGKQALANLGIKEITIPAGVKELPYEAIGLCRSLQKVYIEGAERICTSNFLESADLLEIHLAGNPEIVHDATNFTNYKYLTVYGKSCAKVLSDYLGGSNYKLEYPPEEGTRRVIFNWSAENVDYDRCDVWVWYGDVDGRGYLFEASEYGAQAIIDLPVSVNEIGFIIRKECSDPGSDVWGSATKDYENDRFIVIEDDVTEVYLKSGDATIYHSDDGGTTLY